MTQAEIPADDFYPKRRLGDLYLCELTVLDDHHLGLGFLFADGAEISLEFPKLTFSPKPAASKVRNRRNVRLTSRRRTGRCTREQNARLVIADVRRHEWRQHNP